MSIVWHSWTSIHFRYTWVCLSNEEAKRQSIRFRDDQVSLWDIWTVSLIIFGFFFPTNSVHNSLILSDSSQHTAIFLDSIRVA